MPPNTAQFTTMPMDLGDVRILGMGFTERMPRGLVHRPAGLNSYFFALFHTETTIRLQGIAHHCHSPSFIIWEPDACHHYGHATTPWEYTWLSCDGQLLPATLDTLAIPCNRVLALTDPALLAHILQDLYLEYTRVHPDPPLLRHIVQHGLLEVRRQLTSVQAAQQLPAWAATIKQYLETHYTEPITLGELAEQAHLSMQHFGRKFVEVFGMPPIEYLNQFRMEKARFLLADSNLSIGDVARRTGFVDSNYFTHSFRCRFGMSPREMRKGLSGEAGRQQRAEERRSRELARWLREGWQVVLDEDYAVATSHDPRLQGFWSDEFHTQLPAQHPAVIVDGCLRLPHQASWSGLCWETPLVEELKIEAVVVNSAPDGLNLLFAISGDLHHGYRLRFWRYDYVALETTINGHWEILRRCPLTLDPHAHAYHITYWRSGNVFYAEVDGQRILEYAEPFAPQGPAHRQFAIARFHEDGSADLQVLRVFTRITPRYVDILEPGRVLLREGMRRQAYAWFMQVAEEHPSLPLYHEARYLAALAVPETERLAQEQAFQRVTDNPASPFRRRMLRQWALTRLTWEDITGAVDIALELAHLYPDDDTPQLLGDKLVSLMRRMDPADLEQVLAELARLPLTRLRLPSVPIKTLAPLQGMRLRELFCQSSSLTDISPLQGMPLEQLTLYSKVRDFTPLTNMPLLSLTCSGNGLSDLSPLQGIALQVLDCAKNIIVDLSPLAGMPLVTLTCQHNEIRDLAPLCALPLQSLDCSANHLEDLSPIADLPLQHLACAHNRLSDLSPLQGMLLRTLLCHANHVTDLSPLAGMPLRQLSCGANPLTSLHPLHGMPLEDLAIEGIPLDQDNISLLLDLPLQHLCCDFQHTVLPLLQTHASLLGMNHHARAYLDRKAQPILHALDAWRQGHDGYESRAALHHLATPCGTARYLALPFRMTRQDAEAFCRYCGGTLACPPTAEQYQSLLTYLTTTVYHDSAPLRYHLGVTIDSHTGQYCWLSGEPYHWHYWLTPPTTGIPCFVGLLQYENISWELMGEPDAHCYVVAQWL